MKKLIVLIIVFLVFCQGAQTQESFHEGLKKFQGKEFQAYHSANAIEGQEGHYRPGGENIIVTFKVDRLISGRPHSITVINKADGRGVKLRDQLGDWSTDHQTYPSYYRHRYTTGDGLVFINGLLIELKGLSKDGLSFDRVGKIYAVMKEIEKAPEKETSKKKMSMKEKIAAAKAKLATSGASPMKKEIMDMNLNEVITKYLADMKTKQATADATQEAKYVTEMKKAAEMGLAARQAQSRELSKKIAAKNAAAGDSPSEYTIVNKTGSMLDVWTNGNVYHIQPGSSQALSCTTDAYYPIVVGTMNKQGSLMYDGDDNCGKTVTVN